MVARAMFNLKKLGYDPKAIVAEFGKSENLTEKNKKLEAKLQELEKLGEFYKTKQDEEEGNRVGAFIVDISRTSEIQVLLESLLVE